MSGLLGSRISLISKSDIRYVGTLHEINSDESTVSLENVKSFGSEGRRGNPDEEIAPSDQLYEYIVFRGSDVKDLRIEEHPTVKENQPPPPMPNDPAIVGAQAKPRDQSGPSRNQPPPQMYGQPQFPPPNNFYGGPPPPGQWGRGGPPGPGGPPAFGNMPYPPPPGWYPPGQGFPPGGPQGPGGPGPWSPHAFPGAPQGPPGGAHGPGENQQGPGSAPPTEPKSLAQPGRQPSQAPSPPVESKPSAEEVKQTAESLAQASPQAAKANRPPPSGPRNNRPNPVIPLGGPSHKPFNPNFGGNKAGQTTVEATVQAAPPTSVQDATSAARAAVAVAMAQLGNGNTNAMDNLSNKVNEMRVTSERGGAAGRGRGRGHRTGSTGQAKVEVPDSDFDFMQSNAKFNKQDIVKEAIAGSPLNEVPSESAVAEPEEQPASASEPQVAYNKSSSFFDNISSEARERSENNGQKPGGREWRGEEQRKNMETFGQGSVDGGHRNYRGRGRGRGGRGRGYTRGGRGGPRPQYQQQGAEQ